MAKCFLNLTIGVNEFTTNKINGHIINESENDNLIFENQRFDKNQLSNYVCSKTSLTNELNSDRKAIIIYRNLDRILLKSSNNELEKIDLTRSILSENVAILYMILIGYLLSVTLIYLIWKRLNPNYRNLNLIKFFYMRYYEINYIQPEITMMFYNYFAFLNQNILSNNFARPEKMMMRNEILETMEKINRTPKMMLLFQQTMLSNTSKPTLLNNKIYSKKVKKERRQNQILERKSSTKKIDDLLIKNRLIFDSFMIGIKRSFLHFLDFAFKMRSSIDDRNVDQKNQINYQQLLDALQMRKNFERSKKTLNQRDRF